MNAAVEALERQIRELKQRLSTLRREAEPEPVADVTLRRADGSSVRLAELFAGRSDLLVIHNMGARCLYCTMWADVLSGFARIVQDRAALVLTSPDEPAAMRAFAASRGWTMPLASFAGTTFARDLGFEPEPGKHLPGVSGLRRLSDGTIVRTGWTRFGPGDDFCPPWAYFDLLHGGAAGWTPKQTYAPGTS